MEAARRDAAARRLRLLIIACAAGFLWALLTVFGQASPSSAAQDDDQGSGLLGLVGGAVGVVGDVTGGVVGAVDDDAQATVKVVEPVVAPDVAVLPAPVKEPVARLPRTAAAAGGATASAPDPLPA